MPFKCVISYGISSWIKSESVVMIAYIRLESESHCELLLESLYGRSTIRAQAMLHSTIPFYLPFLSTNRFCPQTRTNQDPPKMSSNMTVNEFKKAVIDDLWEKVPWEPELTADGIIQYIENLELPQFYMTFIANFTEDKKNLYSEIQKDIKAKGTASEEERTAHLNVLGIVPRYFVSEEDRRKRVFPLSQFEKIELRNTVYCFKEAVGTFFKDIPQAFPKAFGLSRLGELCPACPGGQVPKGTIGDGFFAIKRGELARPRCNNKDCEVYKRWDQLRTEYIDAKRTSTKVDTFLKDSAREYMCCGDRKGGGPMFMCSGPIAKEKLLCPNEQCSHHKRCKYCYPKLTSASGKWPGLVSEDEGALRAHEA